MGLGLEGGLDMPFWKTRNARERVLVGLKPSSSSFLVALLYVLLARKETSGSRGKRELDLVRSTAGDLL